MKLKNAITTLIIVLIIAATFITYLIFFNNPDENPPINIDNDLTNTFFPISADNGGSTPGEDANEDFDDFNRSIPKLRQISNVPVSGYISFDRIVQSDTPTIDEETGEEIYEEITETVFRYVERSTGNIYETTDRDLNLRRLTNTTIPKIYEALFTSDGEGVVLRYLDSGNSIETFLGNIDRGEEDINDEEEVENDSDEIYQLNGVYLPKNIGTISKSPVSKDFFYIIENDGQSLGYTFSWDSPTEGNLIFRSDISQWLSDWYSENNINIYTKPTYFLEGFSFTLNSSSGSMVKMFDNFLGLTTKFNPSDNKALISYKTDSSIGTSVFNLEGMESNELSIRTLSDKCAWKNKDEIYCAVPRGHTAGNLPDTWYQGIRSFSDDIVRINTEEGNITDLGAVNDYNFDIINPQISPNGNYFLFTNKNNLTLWSLDISF